MINLFGRRKGGEKAVLNAAPKSKSPSNAAIGKSTIDSIVKMRETIKNLEKREAFLDIRAKAQLDEAIEKNKAGDKKGAVTAMTRKKLFENEALKIMQMKSNLEAQILSVETANVTMVATEGMQAGLEAQRRITTRMNVDQIADMHDEIEEHLQNADEVTRILAGSYNAGDVFDEDELLKELQDEVKGETSGKTTQSKDDDVAALDNLMNSLPTLSVDKMFPDVPGGPPTLEMDDSVADLEKLQREMGL